MQTDHASIGTAEPRDAANRTRPLERAWVDAPVPSVPNTVVYERQLQVRIDSHILNLIRLGDRVAARAMTDISLGLLMQHRDLHPRVFWQISAAYFEAVAVGLTPVQASGKKALAAILVQYRALASGASLVSEGLLIDLLDLIAPSSVASAAGAPVLAAVRRAYGWSEEAASTALRATAALAGVIDQTGACERPGLEDQVKVVGTLRIDIASFNNYLNEADEWSRRLLVELSEWALELHRPVSEDSIALARALAAGSQRIGLTAVSQVADALARALQHVKASAQGRPQQASLLTAAAEEIRRLLHQFAAGFIKNPEPTLLEQLASLAQLDSPSTPAMPTLDPDSDKTASFAKIAQITLLQLGGALRQWSARPDNVGARNEAVRALLALKKQAEQADVTRVYEASCVLERNIEHLGLQALQADQLAPLLADFDVLCAHTQPLLIAQTRVR